ncbi:MAG: type III polyketide synthase, partial [Sporomusa sp.]
MGVPQIVAVGTAVPANCLRQQDIKLFVAALFRDNLHNLDRLLPVFENSLITARHLAMPLEWYGKPHTFAEANSLYQQAALDLAQQAAGQAI